MILFACDGRAERLRAFLYLYAYMQLNSVMESQCPRNSETTPRGAFAVEGTGALKSINVTLARYKPCFRRLCLGRFSLGTGGRRDPTGEHRKRCLRKEVMCAVLQPHRLRLRGEGT